MLSRMKHLPLPPLVGCSLLKQDTLSTLAKRFIETEVPIMTMKQIMSTGGGEALIGDRWVLISNDKVATVCDPETPFALALAGMEAASAI